MISGEVSKDDDQDIFETLGTLSLEKRLQKMEKLMLFLKIDLAGALSDNDYVRMVKRKNEAEIYDLQLELKQEQLCRQNATEHIERLGALKNSIASDLLIYTGEVKSLVDYIDATAFENQDMIRSIKEFKRATKHCSLLPRKWRKLKGRTGSISSTSIQTCETARSILSLL